MKNKKFTFIDLFAGIGGFHLAMKDFSHDNAKCIYAAEIDKFARKVYKDNFDIDPLTDVREIDPSKYPSPDVVCGGFPCQTFSKAGKQDGFKDPRGTLFKEIIRLIEYYDEKDRPKILILENVQNLVNHDNGETWKTIKHEIQRIGYNVINKPIIIEPVNINIPQLRNRAIILAVRSDICDAEIKIDVPDQKHNTTSIYSILDRNDLTGSRTINEYQEYVLDCWNDFIRKTHIKIVGFPIWSDEFGKDYDISNLPKWKQDFVIKNRKLYNENKKSIDKWLVDWDVRNKIQKTQRKFEWQVHDKIHDIYEGIIQFRPSGVRVKLPTESPALVAMVQLPIIGRERRTISVREAARLQSFPDTYIFDECPSLAYKQLGNAINVQVIKYVFSEFVKFIEKNKRSDFKCQ